MIFDTRTKLFLEINFASFKGTKRFGELHDSFSVHLNFFEISFSNNVKTIWSKIRRVANTEINRRNENTEK